MLRTTLTDGSTITSNGCDTLSGPTWSAACVSTTPASPPTASAYTGQWVNSAAMPDSVSVSLAALINVATSAQVIPAAMPYSAAFRRDEPLRAASVSASARPPSAATAAIHVCSPGVDTPPRGSSMATNAASPTQVPAAAIHAAGRTT